MSDVSKEEKQAKIAEYKQRLEVIYLTSIGLAESIFSQPEKKGWRYSDKLHHVNNENSISRSLREEQRWLIDKIKQLTQPDDHE